MNKIRVLLWGLGVDYNRARNIIRLYEYTGQLEVVGITARDLPSYKKFDGYELVEREDICNVEYDYIIVLSNKYFNDIVINAMDSYHISRNKFINGEVLFIPNLNFDKYIRLIESNISIISNNCWGGILCNTLSIECRSPFKNLFVTDDDYLKLISDLQHYLNSDLVFYEFNIDVHSNQTYPVFLLDDICIHCNHASSIESAISDWNRRKKLVNWNNLFVEMYTVQKNIAERFDNIDEYDKIVCFVPSNIYDKRYKKWCGLELIKGQTEFYEAVNSSASNNKNGVVYNWIDLLLYGKIKKRVE
jgi:uncharacterized protein (DUF1919 family)